MIHSGLGEGQKLAVISGLDAASRCSDEVRSHAEEQDGPRCLALPRVPAVKQAQQVAARIEQDGTEAQAEIPALARVAPAVPGQDAFQAVAVVPVGPVGPGPGGFPDGLLERVAEVLTGGWLHG